MDTTTEMEGCVNLSVHFIENGIVGAQSPILEQRNIEWNIK